MVPLPSPALPNFWLGTWSRPPDRPSQIALALASVLLAAALVPGGPRWLLSMLDTTAGSDLGRRRRLLFVMSFLAAFLSLGYVAFYLRGGPRAAESATYWLQGRALSHGHLGWTVPTPTASFRAQNLMVTAPDRVAGIFPPGYALLLAAAFMLGAPMLVGPLLAAALVALTWLLGRELSAGAGEDEAQAEATGRIAAALSVASVGLRYHTAESLPHGAAAAAVALALACGLRARRTRRAPLFAGSGVALGALLATQPASAVGVAAVLLVLALGAREPRRAVAWTVLAALPGAALLMMANHAATGHALESPLALYSARFGSAPPTSGFKSAVEWLRRVRCHLTDVDNFEPLALLPFLLLVARRRRRVGGAAAAATAVIGIELAVLATLGSRDGVGAVGPAAAGGVLAHILPVEHALAALALVIALPSRWTPAATAATLAFALAGFALHASNDHARLGAADLGRPHYEPDLTREAGATHGLLFFDDDEGYELAHDPGAVPSAAIEAVRMRGDDHDRLLYDALGHPSAHRYASGHGAPSVSGWSPVGGDIWRFEAEADFPPVAESLASIGKVEWLDASGTCASGAGALAVTPTGAIDASVTIELPLPHPTAPSPARPRSWTVTPRSFDAGGRGTADLTVVASLGGPPLAEWTWSEAPRQTPVCTDLPPKTVELTGDQSRAWLVLSAHGSRVALDRTIVRAAAAAAAAAAAH